MDGSAELYLCARPAPTGIAAAEGMGREMSHCGSKSVVDYDGVASY
jgi:hypothetical protein